MYSDFDVFAHKQKYLEMYLAHLMKKRIINIGQDADFMGRFITAKRAEDEDAAEAVVIEIETKYERHLLDFQ